MPAAPPATTAPAARESVNAAFIIETQLGTTVLDEDVFGVATAACWR